MPEIVEVQVQVDGLQQLIGETIKRVTVLDRGHVLLSHEPSTFQEALEGLKINGVWRKGKYIVIELKGQSKGSNSEWLYILAHLGMSGAFLINQEHRHERIRFKLSRNTLSYKDMRYFGNINIFNADELMDYLKSRRLGVDALESSQYEIEMDLIKNLYQPKFIEKPIKSLLLNQSVISGLGNIYVSEVLFEAGIHPLKTPKEIGWNDIGNIAHYIGEVLSLSYEVGGSSIKDFTGTGSEEGKFSDYMKVYGRHNKPCVKCNTPIERIKIDNRSSFYCPICQPGEAN